MKVYYFMLNLILIPISLFFSFGSSVLASEYDESYTWLIGGGVFAQKFSEKDDFRKSRTSDSDKDLVGTGGIHIYVEARLTSGLYLGLQNEQSTSFREMKTNSEDVDKNIKIEDNLKIVSNLAYVNYLIGLGDDKYWKWGGTAGYGKTTVTYKSDYKYLKDSSRNYSREDSYEGTISKYGLLLDWGSDSSGGRLGYVLVKTQYEEKKKFSPKGDGSQIFIDYRFAF